MIPFEEFEDILNNNDKNFIEDLARKARAETVKYFGRAISLYAPLYLSSYCDNYCLYCGFRHDKPLKRKKLTPGEMHQEMKQVAASGIQSILLLTGESRTMSPVSYIKEAVEAAKNYFANISIEVYPMETSEYRELFAAGVDGVTIYQETYNRERYKELHIKGKKADYDYRYAAPERIARAGIRTINMGALLGLFDAARDVYQLFLHLERMEKHYPGVEYALSFPRLIPVNSTVDYVDVPDILLIKLICTARILFPRVGINLSTRENARIRDHAIELGVTRISAASKTTVGGYTLKNNSIKHPQFEVMDDRPVGKIVKMLHEKGFDPVFTDWRRIDNE
jgi:2-iminoacetate synthase